VTLAASLHTAGISLLLHAAKRQPTAFCLEASTLAHSTPVIAAPPVLPSSAAAQGWLFREHPYQMQLAPCTAIYISSAAVLPSSAAAPGWLFSTHPYHRFLTNLGPLTT
jgi:hypothetical protein